VVLIYTLPSTMFTINALHKHYIHRLLYVNISAGNYVWCKPRRKSKLNCITTLQRWNIFSMLF